MAPAMKTVALAALPLAAALQVQQPDAEALQPLRMTGGTRSASENSMCGFVHDDGDEDINEVIHGNKTNITLRVEKQRNQRGGGTPNVTLCECRTCCMSRHDAPKLFLQESWDGMGTRLHNIIMGMAIAAKTGYNLGGILSLHFDCPTRIYHASPYNTNARLIYDFVLGVNSTDLFVNMLPPRTHRYKDLSDLEKLDDVIPFGQPDPRETGLSVIEGDNVLEQFNQMHKPSEINRYLTKDFLSNLRRPDAPIWSYETKFNEDGRVKVAVHIRRGDVHVTGKNTQRYSPDSWYLTYLEHITHLLPDADIHIFSSTDERTDEHEFDGFRARGMKVHLDDWKSPGKQTDKVLEAWAHMAKADVLILSKSSFGHVPALLNTNCVIYQAYWNAPLENWIWAADSYENSAHWRMDVSAFNTCLRRIKRQGWNFL